MKKILNEDLEFIVSSVSAPSLAWKYVMSQWKNEKSNAWTDDAMKTDAQTETNVETNVLPSLLMSP